MAKTWFGTLDPKSEEVASFGDLSQMVDELESISSDDFIPSEVGQMQPDLRALALNARIFEDDSHYDEALREVALQLVRRKLRAAANAEAELLQTIETLDDLNEIVNRLDERLYEWSRLRTDERLRGQKLAEELLGEDLIGELAKANLELRKTRHLVETSLETAALQMAPNLSNLAGPLLAARMISRAGSLKRLSEMPASALQVMGAEKSLFKHLKGKAPSPKHGMIYRHPAIMRSPKRLRGKTARALAAKLAIAARIDLYSGELNSQLKASLDKRIDEIRRSNKVARKQKNR